MSDNKDERRAKWRERAREDRTAEVQSRRFGCPTDSKGARDSSLTFPLIETNQTEVAGAADLDRIGTYAPESAAGMDHHHYEWDPYPISRSGGAADEQGRYNISPPTLQQEPFGSIEDLEGLSPPFLQRESSMFNPLRASTQLSHTARKYHPLPPHEKPLLVEPPHDLRQ